MSDFLHQGDKKNIKRALFTLAGLYMLIKVEDYHDNIIEHQETQSIYFMIFIIL